MNNKLLIEEINRVREVMGLPKTELYNNPLILEGLNYLARLIKMLGKKGVVGKLIVKGGPIELLFTRNEDFFWKMKNKYSDELEHVKDVDGLMAHILDNPSSFTVKKMMRDMFMDNPQTRALIAGAADNTAGGISKLDNMVDIDNFVKNMDDLGIPITVDDLAKIADDIFPKAKLNPIRVAIKNAGTIPKTLFGKPKKGIFKNTTTTGIEKGSVITDVMRKQGLKTSDDAYQFFLKIGMTEADAAKIKIAIEKGINADANKVDEIFTLLAKSSDNEIQLTFIDVVSKNKVLKDKIRTGGANGKMNADEIRAYLGLSDEVPLSLIDDISDMVGVKKVRKILKRKESQYFNPDKGWYFRYIQRRWIEGVTWSETSFKIVKTIYNTILLYHIIPVELCGIPRMRIVGHSQNFYSVTPKVRLIVIKTVNLHVF